MANLILHIDTHTVVIYSFKSEIYWDANRIVDYSKTLNSIPGMFTSLV